MQRSYALLLGFAVLLVVCITITNRKAASAVRKGEKPQATQSARAPRTPVIVELFTSEGCSSCPSADAVLTRLAHEQPIPGVEILALGEHVDYWNRLGWADPFSAHAFSVRQSDYADAFHLDQVYTPQAIVDGQAEFVGSDEARAREAIRQAAERPQASVALMRIISTETDPSPSVPLRLHVRVTHLPAVESGETADVFLAITEDNLHSNVSRGENAGRHLAHTAVVRLLNRIGIARAKETFETIATADLAQTWKRENLRAIVFVQSRLTHRILGAGALKVAP